MIPYGTRVLGKQVDSLRAGELDESTKTPLLLVKTSSNKPKTMMENKKKLPFTAVCPYNYSWYPCNAKYGVYKIRDLDPTRGINAPL